jgi:hypothetical protein
MVKTTVILEDELYRKLVQEALDKYGTTRKLSTLINLKLRERGSGVPGRRKERSTIKLGRKLSQNEVERAVELGWRESLKWKP